MCKIKYLLTGFLLCVTFEDINGMSVKQMEAAVRLVRNVCLPKTKATMEDIDKMHHGDWDIDHTAMCYMFCCLNTYKLLDKENRLDYESAMNQLKLLPDMYREPTAKCLSQCKDAVETTGDKCMAAYEVSKCVYFCSPETYFLP